MKINQKISLLGFLFIGLCLFSLITQNRSPIQTSTQVPQPAPPNQGSTVKLYVLGAREPYAIRTNEITIFGYAQKAGAPFWNGVEWIVPFVNSSDLVVFPIINGIKYNGVGAANLSVLSSDVVGHVGEFNISYPVPSTIFNGDLSQSIEFTANITEQTDLGVYVRDDTVQTSPYTLDVIAANMELTISNGPVGTVLVDDTIDFDFALTDELDYQEFPTALDNTYFQVYSNGNPASIIAGATIDFVNGSGTASFSMPAGLTKYGITFVGYKTNPVNTYFEYPAIVSANSSLNVIASIEGILNFTNLINNTRNFAYRGENIAIFGNLTINNNSSPLIERSISVYANGTLVGSNSSRADGFFFYEISTSEFPENSTVFITIMLDNYDPIQFPSNASFILEIDFTINQTITNIPTTPAGTPPATTNWAGLLIPIGIIAGIIIGLVIFQRKRMDLASKRDVGLRDVQKNSKLSIVSGLYENGKGREAIAYTFRIYMELISQKYHLEKELGKTIREYAIMMVTKYGQDPLRIYPYIQMVESVIYGPTKVNAAVFKRALTLFARVYVELTGVQLLYNMPGTGEAIQPMEMAITSPTPNSPSNSTTPPGK